MINAKKSSKCSHKLIALLLQKILQLGPLRLRKINPPLITSQNLQQKNLLPTFTSIPQQAPGPHSKTISISPINTKALPLKKIPKNQASSDKKVTHHFSAVTKNSPGLNKSWSLKYRSPKYFRWLDWNLKKKPFFSTLVSVH